MQADSAIEQLEKPSEGETQRGVRTWLRKQSIGILFVGAILFLSAGTLSWTWGWVMTALFALAFLAQAVILIPISPELIAQRSRKLDDAQAWDMILTAIGASLLPMTAMVLGGLDFRNGWSTPFSLPLRVAGAVAFLMGWGLIIWAMASNAFFSMAIHLQDERDHKVASGGPYRFVRHPGYLGVLLFQAVLPLILGSPWAFIPAGASLPLMILRTALEDRFLHRELDGYEEFSTRTRFRLLPGIW